MKHFFTFLLLAFSTTTIGQTVVYADVDGDGYGDPTSTALCTDFGCPLGYVGNDYDCDDNDPSVAPYITWYKDEDNDGYTDGTTKLQCERPIGYKREKELVNLVQLDCYDNDRYSQPNQQWYSDPDDDGYTAGGFTVNQCANPGHYVSRTQLLENGSLKDEVCCNGTGINEFFVLLDCNQNDPIEHPNQKWYKDQDGDHYISDPTPIIQCSRPAGYSAEPEVISLTIIDCNDNDAGIGAPINWYKDADNDGYYAGSPVTQCYAPSADYKKTVLGGSDCDDNDPLQHPNQVWYADADHDGHGDKFNDIRQCSRPGSSYFAASELVGVDDCVDINSAMYPGAPEVCDGLDNNCNGEVDEGVQQLFAQDKDGDGAGNLNVTVAGCSAPEGYVPFALPGDCDDDNPAISSPKWYYRDKDHDGYGDPNDVITAFCSLIVQYGYSSNNFDCDDNDANVWQSGNLYIDNDGDGYDNGQQTLCYGDVPAGYALTSYGSDCNDNDPRVHSPFTFYWDDDHDGYGDPNNQITLCALTPPKGYVANGNDCDDDNADVNLALVWYKDADNDSYSDGTTQTQCTRPAGYKLASELTATSGDCDDNNAVLNPTTVWYKDSDNDGYGNSSLTQCSRPSGYKLASELTATSGDCNDNDPAISPAAVEVCGNKVDDNCNGVIDETTCYTCQNGSNLTTTNISSSSAQVNWSAVANPQQWQLQYKSIAPGAKWVDVPLLTGNIRAVKITSLKANQTYNWHVRAKCKGVWTTYSASITFKTTGSSTVGSSTAITLNNLTLKLYPNPNKGQFVIELNVAEKVNANAKIQLIDMTGKTVHTENAEIRNGTLQKTITVSPALTKGIYMVRIIANGKVYKTQLVYER